MGVLESPRLEARLPLSEIETRCLLAADRVLAAGALIAATPILAAAAIAVWRLSGRTPFVSIERVGRGGQPFRMLKLRTMWNGRDRSCFDGLVEPLPPSPIPNQKDGSDPRVTHRLAALLRRFSIDELPQLVHVLRGEMSLVGPRPLTAWELEVHYGPAAAEVLRLRPGLSGLWQVSGRNRLCFAERLQMDLKLVRQYGWGMYWRVLLKTVPCVLGGKDAW